MSAEKKHEDISTVDNPQDQNGEEPSAQPPQEQKKRIFFLRTIICIVVPVALAAYYIWTYATWLRPGTNVSATNTMNLNGKLGWWSWFIIGAIGLNISNYSLAGVEAGMLASAHFNINNDQIIWHIDNSWSTLGGWKILGSSLYDGLLSKTPKKSRPSSPWMILFGLSVLSWAFVLSGLTMNLSSGYTSGHHAGTTVTGVNATTMNNRVPYTVLDSAFQRWRFGTQPQIPSGGAFYVSPGSTIIANISTPNILPRNASEGIFIAPQASLPVTGSAWGLLLNYSCTPVHSLTDFTILNQRMNSTPPGYIHSYVGTYLAPINSSVAPTLSSISPLPSLSPITRPNGPI